MESLRRGEVVAFPTETYYGLGVNALDARALERLVSLKGREPQKPFSLLVSDRAMLGRIAEVPPEAEPFVARYWPGPLTLVLPVATNLPRGLASEAGEIAVRISSHPLAGALVESLGQPLTATSANRAGGTPARTPAEVRRDFPNLPVLDGGETAGGPATTVLRFDRGRPVVLRQGVIGEPWPK